MECLDDLQGLSRKRSTLGSQYALLIVDCSQQGNAPAILVYEWLFSGSLIAGCFVQ